MQQIQGAGLGLRRGFIEELLRTQSSEIDFLEIAPENWMQMGGKFKRNLQEASEIWPIICHGLSLSIGGPTALDIEFVKNVKTFLDAYQIDIYSEHLSYCSDEGHLYDLMPIPFTEEAVHYVAGRIRQVQDIIERPLIMENVSYYAKPTDQMTEIEFTKAVLKEANCPLLLDVNNIYVNSINHKEYTPTEFLEQMADVDVRYVHVAGHLQEEPDLIIDTHGANVSTDVWQILGEAYKMFGALPTLLERDFNFPPIDVLIKEVKHIKQLQK